MNLTPNEEKLVQVWRLFCQIQNQRSMSYPEITLFEDGSGSLIGDNYALLVDWGNLDDAIERLEQYLGDQ